MLGGSAFLSTCEGTCQFIKPPLLNERGGCLFSLKEGGIVSRFCCLWIPHFPAWAAARADPSLKGKPLLIHASGRVLAASLEARQSGVQAGWSLGRAAALLPDAILLPQHGAVNAAAWDEVLRSLYDFTPQLESVRQGLALLQISPDDFKPLLCEWAAHGGAADDRSTAELAAFTTTPGTLRCVRVGHSHAFLKTMPTAVLGEAGVRAEVVERLGWFGWNTIGALRPLTFSQSEAQFDNGDILYRYAQANDTRPVVTHVPPLCVTASYQFEEPAREPYEIEPVLDALLRGVCEQLGERAVCSVTVMLHTSMERLQSARLLREPTTSRRSLREAAHFALHSLFLHSLLLPDLDVGAVEVRLSGLTPASVGQGQLFGVARPPVQSAIRAVERRFPGLLRRIVLLDADAYLPEEAFRFEPASETPPAPLARRAARRRITAPKRHPEKMRR